eukprot:CAMPEP_0203999990 /NCGR_PEP_ID=MMETSP0360-20130528/15000_1 /ASSEMBLY_ACC=CAM_ASM_000342 /TAXON_ID=268821 /ORGANISM="Scrippsiella Hangoei, Strain SHTV-5" /LENGTH=34 /DNA_ID= /DNA_START= /DNA_END= /DNA_ORIENTATION=
MAQFSTREAFTNRRARGTAAPPRSRVWMSLKVSV